MNEKSQYISDDVEMGTDVYLGVCINLYGCSIGDESKIGAFVEIQRGVTIGARCKISSHSFICSGVTIEDNVFIGHGVMFTNDMHPRATTPEGLLETAEDWASRMQTTVVRKGAVIGSNATIGCGLTIGAGATIGMGAVVTKDVPPGATVVGNPACILEKR
ncbi:MAG TPA: acyltransferase [Candidatus Paceibacterota bacterium]|nr:acyltransferase [Candidatus Paceibacterota bacterium]